MRSAQRPRASSSGSRFSSKSFEATALAAQRPRASSSGSRRPPAAPPVGAGLCSTPEGVFVGFTVRIRYSPAKLNAAQRPRASSSGSLNPDAVTAFIRLLLNARGRLRRVHRPPPRPSGSGPLLLNARGRLRRVHEAIAEKQRQYYNCSTPEGVFVGFTAASRSRRIAQMAAQRPRASSSGSLDHSGPPCPPFRLLNARGRLRRVHPLVAGALGQGVGCSTPEGVFVGFTARS